MSAHGRVHRRPAPYVYPKGDVMWVVSAVEPALSEVFSKLP